MFNQDLRKQPLPNHIRFFSIVIVFHLLVLAGCSHKHDLARPISIDEFAIEVTDTSREVAYTNKQAGFFYTESNRGHRSAWQGWNVMAKEILEDYQITDGGRPLRKTNVKSATVLPHQLQRHYDSGVRETVTLLDSLDALVIQIVDLNEKLVSIQPLFRDSRSLDDFIVKSRDGILLTAQRKHLQRTAKADYPVWIGIAATPSTISTEVKERADTVGSSFSPAYLQVPVFSATATFIIVAGDSEEETVALASLLSKQYKEHIAQRRARMENLLNRSFLRTDNSRFDKAFHWALLSADALIMNQVKKGIFAGLPWFNNYWGRDSFIALPGATLVTGNFAEAREILRSFAEWQQVNPGSPNYGRIPNLVTTGSMQYNTTDGTPRFVIALLEYFRHSNDTAFVRTLYPVVRRSIQGALARHVDGYGFLRHGDAETWMDAAGPAGPWSPRGDRANDIQALWCSQLKAGAMLARLVHDTPNARLWEQIAVAVRSNFNKYFIDATVPMIIDHLNTRGEPDHQFRPNQLFALEMIDRPDLKAQLFKSITEHLVYPHGVASLSQNDDQFHPYHHYQPYYVQDAAYHNGIVWTWLAGSWIDHATAYGHSDLAWTVTENMVHQILDRGAVGTLSELLDAAPRPGEREPRLSGTFSQAWSLSEFLRVFYQDYAGVRVDAPAKQVEIHPHLPSSLQEIQFSAAIANGHIEVRYSKSAGENTIVVHSRELRDSLTIVFQDEIRGAHPKVSFQLPPDTELEVTLGRDIAAMTVNGQTRILELTNPASTVRQPAPDSVTLATPTIRPGVKSLQGPHYQLLTNNEIKTPAANATVVCNLDDPAGDDNGPGSYKYPTTPVLKPGSLDITHFAVTADDRWATFSLRFRELSDPGWHPEYGFQLTYAAIAINKDGKERSGCTAIGMNSHYSLAPSRAYETIIFVGGGLQVEDSKGKILAAHMPVEGDEAHPLGDAVNRMIEFSLPLDVIGKPENSWRFTVLVGCQDDHGGAGIGEFRTVAAKGGEWTGGGRKKPSDPNVYDVVEPLNRK
jgi:glycogen debranching enzyme